MTKFLLPCTCGRRITVMASQAGQRLPCECGASVEVPTLRYLSELERLEEAAPEQPKSWGARQGLILLGALTILAAGGWLVYLHFRKPPDLQQFRTMNVDAMSPGDIWTAWALIERGVKRPVLSP